MNGALRTFAVTLLATALSVTGPLVALADPGPTPEPIVVSDPNGSTTVTTTASTPTVSSTDTTASVSDSSVSTTLHSSGTVTVTETTATVTTSSGSVTTDSTTTTLFAPPVTATTTGTSASASVPPTTVTVGTVSGGSSPDLSAPSTGSGSATATQGVTPSGTGLVSGQDVSTSLTDPSSPATLMASDGTVLDEGAAASVDANEPVTGTTLSGAAGAHALICLLAEASVDPTRASLASLCGSGPSSLDGAADLGLANAPTGATVTTGAALRAAVCLLGLVASPLPGDISSAELASASLSTLCGGEPSTVSGGSDLSATNERTGTDLAAAPIVAAATCILANGTVGDPTVARLSSLCAPATDGGGTPSTIDASAPTQATDATTGTSADLAPAASAATCILLDALAQVPESSEPAAAASLNTACGSTSGGTTPTPTPSTIETSPPATISTPGPDTDIAPAVKAAVCILTNAQASTGGASLAATDACAGTSPAPQGPTSGPGPTTTTPTEPAAPTTPETPSTVAGVQSPPSVGGPVAGVSPVIEPAPVAPAGIPAGIAQTGQLGEAAAPAASLAGLPSTATVAFTGGLIAALLATMAALGRRRRS